MVKYYRTSQTNPNRQRRTVPSTKSIINKRTSNSVVAKKYVKKTTKPTATINKSAIMTLSKQVKQLQLQRYGFKQFQHQHIQFSYFMQPSVLKPYAFMVNDFYNASKIYRGIVSGGAVSYEEPLQFDKVESTASIDAQYLWNNKQQKETVSLVHYLPISTTLKFRVEYQSTAALDRPIRVRVQVFKFKNQTVNGKFKMTLPHNLGAYWHMCDRYPTTRNHLNTHEYHDVVVDKSVYLTPILNHTATNTIDKYINCKIQFPAKEVKLDQTTDPADQKLYNIIPTNEQYWCLISTDSTETDKLKIHLERWNVWRDSTGVGS